MEKPTTTKEVIERASTFGPVKNLGDLLEAVPLLLDGSKRLRWLADTVKKAAKVLSELSEKCSKYALEHPTCFDEGGLAVSQIGVQSGDLTIDGTTYHFSSGFSTPIREDGGKLTQDYLLNLPEGWVKMMAKLDTTGIERVCGTKKMDEQLQHYGLYRPAKNVWIQKEEVVAGEW